MPGTMRGVYTNLTEIRRKVFREVAKICYRMGDEPKMDRKQIDDAFDELPFQILPGDVATPSMEHRLPMGYYLFALSSRSEERR